MITYEDFEQIIIDKIGRKISSEDDFEQNKAINASKSTNLFMVAGPGSGKTTVMVLKILKFIFVDDIDPSSILATTFTVKAALELRSRIYNWGNIIIKQLEQDENYDNIDNKLKQIDLNQIITGTLDSICYDILNNFREPGTSPPVLIDNFVAKSIMLRFGLFKERRYENTDLEIFLKEKIVGSSRKINPATKSELLIEIKDRFYNDDINFKEFCRKYNDNGAKVACSAISSYIKALKDKELLDYSILEKEFLNKAKEGKLRKFMDSLNIILVDEYQDTNSLQESIYFEFAKAAIKNKGSITVVGDDDQSLYRFRGATVDLFVEFQSRLEEILSIKSEIVKLSKNYRSTSNIVEFCNEFINLDEDFKEVRVTEKESIKSARTENYINYPILGIFREDLNSLSEDLSNFIGKITNKGITIDKKNNLRISINPNEGSENDIALLISSPSEYNFMNYARFPSYLRKDLLLLDNPIEVFNPRGQSLDKINDVCILLGLILECIDPLTNIQDQIDNLPKDTVQKLNFWRDIAYNYLENDPEPNEPLSLLEFIYAWQDREPKGRKKWKKSIPLLDLVYKLIRWIPSMQNDIEGMVYLEAISRTISQTALFSNYEGNIDFRNSTNEEKSIKEAIWNIFVPLATSAIDIDEDLLENLPKNRLNIMSIHQSKGLEFPLVIVDVGSEFNSNNALQRFKRFPKEPSKDCNLESELRRYSNSLNIPERDGVDRSFDDLIRKYFVAFSRAQDVLVLVGLNSCLDKEIPNVATGWNRNKEWKKYEQIKYI